tara:strand:- start:4944 stop:5762 length:819 start_codon:yes stop_codon:yes gene_type:complete
MSDVKDRILSEAKDFLSGIDKEKSEQLKKTGHPHTFENDCVPFLYLRDHLTRKNFRRYDIVKYQEELLLLSRQQLRTIKIKAQKDKQAEMEKLRLEKYRTFTGGLIKDGDSWYNCKVEKVVEYLPDEVYGNWDEWKRLRLEGGKKAQVITLATGEELIATVTKSARGVKPFDIIDCKVENNKINIVKGSMQGDFGGIVSRPISVTVIEHGRTNLRQFNSVASAYRYLSPDYSYATVCEKTKKAASQEETDDAFYSSQNKATGNESMYRHAKV